MNRGNVLLTVCTAANGVSSGVGTTCRGMLPTLPETGTLVKVSKTCINIFYSSLTSWVYQACDECREPHKGRDSAYSAPPLPGKGQSNNNLFELVSSNTSVKKPPHPVSIKYPHGKLRSNNVSGVWCKAVWDYLKGRNVIHPFTWDFLKTDITKYRALTGTLCATLARDEREQGSLGWHGLEGNGGKKNVVCLPLGSCASLLDIGDLEYKVTMFIVVHHDHSDAFTWI